MKKKSKPTWWLAFALAPLMIVLLVIEGQTPGSLVEHRILEIGIVILTFGLMGLWVHANQAALMDEEMEKGKWYLAQDPKIVLSIDSFQSSAEERADTETCVTEREFGSSKERYN